MVLNEAQTTESENWTSKRNICINYVAAVVAVVVVVIVWQHLAKADVVRC